MSNAAGGRCTGAATIFTIGHSTQSADSFLALLRAHGIYQLGDIRAIPQSKRHPQFGQTALETLLTAHGITYRHFHALGGRRQPRPDSINTGWRQAAFRGYADHMQTEEFRRGVEALEIFAGDAPTAVMCAEAVWWHCHRRLLSDALLSRGAQVRHILTSAEPKPHELSEFARERNGGLIYPALL